METEASQAEVTGCPVSGGMTLRGDESRVDPEIWDNPWPFYKALRDQAPVFYDTKLNTYIVSRYEDAVEIMKDDETYSFALAFEDYAAGHKEEFFEILRREGGASDSYRSTREGPEHMRRRRLQLTLFTFQRVKDLEDRTRQVVVDLIEPLADRGHGDGIHDIGIPLTARIMCEQLGLDFEAIGAERFAGWSRAALAQMGRRQSYEDMIANAHLLAEKHRLLVAAVKDHQDNPREDMISWLFDARIDDDERPQLAFEEVVGIVSGLMVAGADTTGAALANLMLALATEPEIVAKLQETVAANEDRLITKFVEEVLRLYPPTHGLWRVPRKDVEIAGVQIPAGSQVCVMFASANDDEAQFPCPRDLDVSRPNLLSHMTFGGGIHRCVGAPLARMEVKVAAQEIIKRLDNIKLAVPFEDLTYADTFATYTLESLPLTFTRRVARSSGSDGV